MTDSILNDFTLEANELLDTAEESLLDLEKDKPPGEVFNITFRLFHNLKGSAGMMDMTELQSHMHLIEDKLQSFENKKLELKNHVDFFLNGIDAARRILCGQKIDFNYEIKDEEGFNTISTKTFESLKAPVIIIGASRRDCRSIIEKLDIDVLCVLSVNDLTDLRDQQKPLTIVVKENLLEETVSFFDQEVSNHSIISWGKLSQENYLNWNEKLGEGYLKKLIAILSTDKQLRFAFNKSIMLLMYQFSDIENFLKASGKYHTINTLKQEICSLMEVKSLIRGK